MTGPPGRCPACFERSVAGRACACGYDPSAETSPLILPPGTSLRGYAVGLVLGTGGFGVTHLGWDRESGRRVAIKEYLPRDHVGRASGSPAVKAHSTEDAGFFRKGLERFLQEAEVLKHFDHPNVVKVVDFFQENGTAYIVMPYYDGTTLGKFVEQRGRLAPEVAVRVILGVLDGLSHVHQRQVGGKRWIHRDVKPDNVFLRSEGSPILLDFGAARAEVGEHSRSMTVVLTPGFAPYEQYFMRGREQGPWVDVYGAAATLYFALTGVAPPSSMERQSATSRGRPDPLLPPDRAIRGVSVRLSEAIRQGLAIDHRTRPHDATEYRTLLRRAVAPPLPPRPHPWWAASMVAAVLLTGVLASWAVLHKTCTSGNGGNGGNGDTTSSTSSTTTSTTTSVTTSTTTTTSPTTSTTTSTTSSTTTTTRPPTGCDSATGRWETIQNSRNEIDHLEFIEGFRDCTEAEKARHRLDEIQAWRIVDKRSARAVQRYLQAYASGLYAAEAAALERALKESDRVDDVEAGIPGRARKGVGYRAAGTTREEARKLLESGDYDGAMAKFQAARVQLETVRAAAQKDTEDWSSIKDSRRPEDFEGYVRRHPQGLFVEEARDRIKKLRAPGRLAFLVIPWARVTVDGRFLGETPLQPITLPPGDHVVLLDNDQYKPLQKKVTIVGSETTLLEIDLRQEAFPK